MIIELLVVLYIIAGLVIATATAYENRDEPWPFEIQGFMVVAMLGPLTIVYAVIQVYRGKDLSV